MGWDGMFDESISRKRVTLVLSFRFTPPPGVSTFTKTASGPFSLRLSGQGSVVSLPASSDLGALLANEFSIEAWVRLEASSPAEVAQAIC